MGRRASPSTLLLVAWALLVALGSGACGGCRPSASAAVDGGSGGTSTSPSEAWLDGRPLGAGDDAGAGRTPRRGGTLTIRLPQEPAMLNPLHDQGRDAWGTRVVMGTVYETLAVLDPGSSPPYRLKPHLALGWDVSEDGRTQTFRLRPGVTFHDGAPFTAADVAAVLDAVKDERLPTAAVRSAVLELERWEVTDPLTLVVRWRRPAYYGFRQLASSLPVLPRGALQGEWGALPVHRAPVGTGPFRFASWEPGAALRLTRFDGYWQAPAHLDAVTFKIVKDATLAAQMWREGAFDLMTSVSPSLWRALEVREPSNAWAWSGYRRIRFEENNYGWIGWNQARPFFRDVKVRTALAHLYPAARVAEGIDLGLERPTTCPFFRGSTGCDPTVTPIAYDPARARTLLDEAGWRDGDGDGVREKDGVPFAFTFLVSAGSDKLTRLVPLLQEEYRKAGIRLEIERVEWATFLERLRSHRFDAASLLWATRDVEGDLFATFHSTQRDAYNYVSYASPVVDALLVRARETFDDAKRDELLRELHRTLYRDQVYTFLTTRPLLDAAKVRVKGLKPSLTWYDLRQVWLEPE